MKQSAEEVNNMPPAMRSVSNASVDTATLELLERWKHQDATDDPEEIRTAERELAEFKQAMNENRALSGEHPLYP